VSVTPQPFTQDDIELMAQVRLAEQKLLAEYQDSGHKEPKEAD